MPVEIERISDIRRRILKCHSEVSDWDSAKRRKALSALEHAKRLISLGRRKEALKALLDLVSSAGDSGRGWMVSDASGRMPLHVRAWELITACYDEGAKEAADAKEAGGLAVRELKLINDGIVALKKGDYGKAGREFYAAGKAGKEYAAAVRKFAGKISGTPATSLIYLGYAHMLAGDSAGAGKKLDAALRLDGRNAEAWGAKCSLLDSKGRRLEAERCYARMRKLLDDENR